MTRARAHDVVLTHPDGRPLADTDVTISQLTHAFGFGSTGFELVDLANGQDADGSAQARAARWLDVFNTAPLPFYWRQFESERGRPDTERLLAAARWFTERGVRVKGHPLAWHTIAPTWLQPLSTDEVGAAVRARVQRDVTTFSGLVDTWDVINEVVIMPVFANEAALEGDVGPNALSRFCRERGRIATVRMVFDEARAADPRATLLINDFNLGTAYECLIEGLLEARIPIDAIGLQSHMHQGYWGEDRVLDVCDRFARYGLPLHWTETTLVSGDLIPAEIEDLNDYQPASWPSTPEGEARQAEELERHYRTLTSHPAVEAITYWGLPDAGAWLGAPAGLVRLDGTPKPGYDTLKRLIRDEWWVAPTPARTDASGHLTLTGWPGEYRVASAGTEQIVVIT